MCLEVVFSLIHSSWYLVGPINLYIYIFLQYLGMLFYHLCSLYIFYILFFPRILSKWLQDFLDWSCMSYIYSLILFSVLLIYILRELLNFKFFLWKFYFSNHTSKRAEQSLSTAHFGAGKGRGIAQGCVVSAHSFIHSFITLTKHLWMSLLSQSQPGADGHGWWNPSSNAAPIFISVASMFEASGSFPSCPTVKVVMSCHMCELIRCSWYSPPSWSVDLGLTQTWVWPQLCWVS